MASKLLFPLASSLLLISCGGGGGDDDNAANASAREGRAAEAQTRAAQPRADNTLPVPSYNDDPDAPPAPFGEAFLGHFVTGQNVEAIRPNRGRSIDIRPLGLDKIQATWLPDGVLVQFAFNRDNQSEDYRSLFRRETACAAVLQPDNNDQLRLSATTCPEDLSVRINNVRRGVPRGQTHPHLFFDFAYRDGNRLIGPGQVKLFPAQIPSFDGLFQKAGDAADAPYGMGFDLAGVQLGKSIEETFADIDVVLGDTDTPWSAGSSYEPERMWWIEEIAFSNNTRVDFAQAETYGEMIELMETVLEGDKRNERVVAYATRWLTGWMVRPGYQDAFKTSPETNGFDRPVEVFRVSSSIQADGTLQPFSIHRSWEPKTEDRPTRENLIASLEEKYGKPSKTSVPTVLHWYFDYQGDQVTDCERTAMSEQLGRLANLRQNFRSPFDRRCLARLSANISFDSNDLAQRLEMSLNDQRLFGEELTTPQWIEVRNQAEAMAASIVEDAGLLWGIDARNQRRQLDTEREDAATRPSRL